MQRILVAGDIVRNHNLVRLPADASLLVDGLPFTTMRRVLGGARNLANVLEVACSDLGATIFCDGASNGTASKPHPETLTIWAQYERDTGSQLWVWRVEQFLRTHVVDSAHETTLPEMTLRQSDRFDGAADLLVLDDENFGFRDDPNRWQHLLGAERHPGNIVLKTRSPLGTGPLWHELISHHHERLTIVVPVSSLRSRHAPISRALSWDRTVEDVHHELTEGASASDIGRAHRIVIPFSYEGVAVFTRVNGGSLGLERFVYHPEQLEGRLRSRQPGGMLGSVTLLSAAVVRHLARPDDYPLFVALSRALAAMAASHKRGGGSTAPGDPFTEVLVPFSVDVNAQEHLRSMLHWTPAEQNNAGQSPESAYRAVSHHRSESAAPSFAGGDFTCSLLHEATGPGAGHMLAAAIQVVTLGTSRALDSAPRARYADFLTVDREEIERTNEIQRLFEAYRTNADPVPISIAVFGPPGSGKSFAIKQLARHLFGQERETLEWNLSQMANRLDLLTAFDQIRDASVRGKIPLVFWDEFDSNDLGWLKEFLSPMQDAQYCAGSLVHPFAKVIFIFAGGTSSTFQEFDRSLSDDAFFRNRKGPDFVSRLRGYVNIKGPNPAAHRSAPQLDGSRSDGSRQLDEDAAHLIRRAFLLRSVIARTYPHLIDRATDVASISPSVIRGFLCVNMFHHGARSIEQLVKMSDLKGARHFGVAQLPSPAMLRLHVSDDFMHRVIEGETEEQAVELLAHAPAWESFEADVSPSLEERRHRARLLIEELRHLGYRVVRPVSADESASGLSALSMESQEELLRIVHGQWLRDHRLRGYDHGQAVNRELRLHPAVRVYGELPEYWRDRLRRLLADVLDRLAGSGYAITLLVDG